MYCSYDPAPRVQGGDLDDLLQRVAMENNTLILTMVNKPYAENNSMFDLFLQSFQEGEDTQQLIKHLLVVAVDQVSFDRCRQLHLHCYKLNTGGEDYSYEQFFSAKDYVKMMWRRLLFVADVVGRGYDILFTDSDVLWLRNPFPRLSFDDDMQVSCDRYRGEPYLGSLSDINAGFYFVRSNSKTIKLYKLWYESRDIGIHEQDVLQKLQKKRAFQELGLRFRLMETRHFSGFCQKSTDLSVVNTMHANCCKSMKAKLADLRSAFKAWKEYMASEYRTGSKGTWPNFTICRASLSLSRLP
ncbi:unnamed protein product [Victoria cruziana]